MGRKAAKTENSTEIIAVEKMAVDIQTAEEQYGDGMPYELERIENQVRFFRDQAGIALLEMGKCLIRIKAHEGHGRFLTSLESLGMSERAARYAMEAARRFSNRQSIADLGPTKMIALTVLDDEEIGKLESGGEVAGLKLDDIDRMTVRELRENLRKEREKVKKEKEFRKNERAAFEQSLTQKDSKLNQMDILLKGQDLPTVEQAALAVLNEMTGEYTIAIAQASTARGL